jgi:hypothetical protein
MKKVIYSIFTLLITSLAFSQAVEMEEITLNDGMEKDYIKFENMFSSAHEKIQQNGEKAGWFLFKVIQLLGVILFYSIFTVTIVSLTATGAWEVIKKRIKHSYVRQIIEK